MQKEMRQRVGTVIEGVQPEAIADELQTWFYSVQWGQYVTHLDFSQHVLLVDVKNPPLAQLEDRHPIAHCALLYYRYDVNYHELTVLSTLAEFANMVPPYSTGPEHELTATVDPSRYFYLTHLGPHFDMHQWLSFHGQQLPMEILLEEALPRKVDSYLAARGATQQHQSPEPLMDCAAAILAGLLGHWLEHLHPAQSVENPYDGESLWGHYLGKRFRTEYERARERVECSELLAERLSHFCSQTLLFDLFEYNSLMPWLESHVTKGMARDYRAYAAMYPEAPYAPSHFIMVPCWEVPSAEASVELPVYKHGMLHLPCYWRALLPWLQQRWRAYRDYSYAHWDHPRDSQKVPAEVRAALDKQVLRVYRHYHEHRFAPPPPPGTIVTASQQQQQQQHPGIADADRTNIGDIEDMWNLLPPCAAALRDAGRFPRNWERIQLYSAFWYGGVAAPAIRTFFETLNDRHSNGERFEMRFNLEAQQEMAIANPKTYKSWCSQIIDDTLTGKQDRLQCPFAGIVQKRDPKLAADFIGRDRKNKGTSAHPFTTACADLCNDGRPFGCAPAHIVANALKKKKKLAGEEPVQKKVALPLPPPPPAEIDEYAGDDYLMDVDELGRDDAVVLCEDGLAEEDEEESAQQ